MLNFRYRIKELETGQLDELMITSNCIWNYALMLQRKSYKWYGKYIPCSKLCSYIAKKRKRNPYWMKLNSQSVQGIVQALDESYQRFFHKLQKRPPKFKRWSSDTSIRFTQSGYSIDNDVFKFNKIGSFRFLKHRPYPTDKVRQVRLKRYNNRFYVIVTCDVVPKQLVRNCNGEAGIDFGLKNFITLDNGETIESPRFLFANARKLRRLSQRLSRKQKGSNRREKAKRQLANFHAHVSWQRDDWQWKTAHDLCKTHSKISIEDLCITGWIAMWGRKASDLAVGSFIKKLKHVAGKYGTEIVVVDRFYPSSHICHCCGSKLDRKLGFEERTWQCVCGVAHDRDVNAAINIKQWDATVRGADVRPSRKSGNRNETRTRSPRL
jgi:putative transposase